MYKKSCPYSVVFTSFSTYKSIILYSLPLISHQNSSTPTTSNLYLANSLATALSDPVLFRHLTFLEPSLKLIFRCLGCTNRSVQIQETWVVELILLNDLHVSPQDMMKLVTNHQRWWEVTFLSISLSLLYTYLLPFCTAYWFPVSFILVYWHFCHSCPIPSYEISFLALILSFFYPLHTLTFFLLSPSYPHLLPFAYIPFLSFIFLCVSLFLSQFLSNSTFITICYCL